MKFEDRIKKFDWHGEDCKCDCCAFIKLIKELKDDLSYTEASLESVTGDAP